MTPRRLRTLSLVLGLAGLGLGLVGLVVTISRGEGVFSSEAGGAWAAVAGGFAVLITLHRHAERAAEDTASAVRQDPPPVGGVVR